MLILPLHIYNILTVQFIIDVIVSENVNCIFIRRTLSDHQKDHVQTETKILLTTLDPKNTFVIIQEIQL
jgi:hypothetical protein